VRRLEEGGEVGKKGDRLTYLTERERGGPVSNK